MSTIVPKLFNIYRAAGYEPITGYSPYHFFNVRDVPCTMFLKNNVLSGCPGVALQEIMFFEQFREFISPQRILIIGNAFGWSTIAFALIFPKAKTVAIDPNSEGVNFTNELIARNSLSACAVVGRSPENVAEIASRHLGGSVDFSLIDAIHTNEAIIADFAAVKATAVDQAFYLFHDVINLNMISGFNDILARYGLKGKVFTRTASGMALAYATVRPEFENYLNCFTEPAGIFDALRACWRNAGSAKPQQAAMRDTDLDWRTIGANEPYFGVYTHPDFLRQNLDAANKAVFFASGERLVTWTVDLIKSKVSAAFAPTHAVDFGCGVGRLSFPMARYAGRVTGVDLSAGMLTEAKRQAALRGLNIDFRTGLPIDSYDWVNSHIVFQHIPPARGYVLLGLLLRGLVPSGVASIHLMTHRDDNVGDPYEQAPVGTMMMYDYDLTHALKIFRTNGIPAVWLSSIDHGPYHGFLIVGQKSPQ